MADQQRADALDRFLDGLIGGGTESFDPVDAHVADIARRLIALGQLPAPGGARDRVRRETVNRPGETSYRGPDSALAYPMQRFGRAAARSAVARGIDLGQKGQRARAQLQQRSSEFHKPRPRARAAAVTNDVDAGGEHRPIRVLIVEIADCGGFAERTKNGLNTHDEITVVGVAETAHETHRLAFEESPDVILIGNALPINLSIEIITRIRSRYPTVPTIVAAASESDDDLLAAVRAGASACCAHHIKEAELIQLIKRCATGEYVINEQLLDKPHVAALVVEPSRSATASELAATGAIFPLTDRELEILKKVSDGSTNAEIGSALGISAQNVKNHVTSIQRKLAAIDRTQAVITALKHGWLSKIDRTAKGSRTDSADETETT